VPRYAAGLSAESSSGLVLLLLDLHGHGYHVAQIFYGLWLLPLGYLVYRSGYFPRALGAFPMIGCAGSAAPSWSGRPARPRGGALDAG
jgi:hypothetical protein